MKICRQCGCEKPLDDFYDGNGIQGKQAYCKLCMSERGDKYHDDLRREVLAAYGRVCYCCGEDIVDFLTLDHVHRDGKQDEKRGRGWYLRLKRENFPDKDRLRVACWNCNLGREANGGVCPHAQRNSNTEIKSIGV